MPPPLSLPDGPAPLYYLISPVFSLNPTLAVITGFLLVLAETWMINVLLNRHELVVKNSSLAALVFIILMSSSPLFLTLHPLNICTLIGILIMNNLLKSYSRADDLDLVYGAGFSVAVGSMFYFPFMAMLLILPVSFILFRSSKWREWAAGLIGFLTPYLFLAVYYFMTDQLLVQIQSYRSIIASFLFYPMRLNADDWIIGIFTLVLVIYGMLYLLGGPMEKTAEIRAKTYLVIWLIPLSFISVAYSTSLLVFHIMLIFPSLTMMLTSAFLGIRRKRWSEILFLAYFLAILVNSYFYNPN
jgi:hypothetical protein